MIDRLVNGYQGVTWRLGYGIDNPNEPEGGSFPSQSFPKIVADVHHRVARSSGGRELAADEGHVSAFRQPAEQRIDRHLQRQQAGGHLGRGGGVGLLGLGLSSSRFTVMRKACSRCLVYTQSL